MKINVIELNETNFEREVLVARQPVLVQFWAGWSGACRAMQPLLDSVAEGEVVPVKVARVNVERHEALADQYGVRTVPTLLIFDRGSLQDQIVGCTTELDVREKLEPFRETSWRQIPAAAHAG